MPVDAIYKSFDDSHKMNSTTKSRENFLKIVRKIIELVPGWLQLNTVKNTLYLRQLSQAVGNAFAVPLTVHLFNLKRETVPGYEDYLRALEASKPVVAPR